MERRGSNNTTKYRLSNKNYSKLDRENKRVVRTTLNSDRRNRGKVKGLFVGTLILITLGSGLAFGNYIIRTRIKDNLENSDISTEIILNESVKIDDIDITGMSKQEVHDVVLKKYDWGMKVSYNGEIYDLNNIIEEELNQILNEIFLGKPKSEYTIKFKGLENLIDAEVEAVSNKWNVKARNATLIDFNKDTGEYIYEDGKDGLEIDVVTLKENIVKAVEEKNFKAIIEVNAKVTKPSIATKEEVKALYKVIGTFTTTTTDNKDRNINIDLANKALDGKVIKPGEEFSFNLTTGNRTLEKGYRPAGAYLNGKLIEEPGGGVCQVSSTLYNAVIFSGLTTTERHAHSFEPNYVTPGEDAMVSYDGYSGPDMKFVNTSDVAIVLRAKLIDKKLTVSVVGIPILDSDEKVYMTSSKIKEYEEPTPDFENDSTLLAGQDVVIKKGTKGSRWSTNIVHKKGDNILKNEVLHYSTYKGKSAIVKRNIALTGTGEINISESLNINESFPENESIENQNVENSKVPVKETILSSGPSKSDSSVKVAEPEIISIEVPSESLVPNPVDDEIITPLN